MRLFKNASVDIYHLNYDFNKVQRKFQSSQLPTIINYLRGVKYDGGTKINKINLPAGYNEVLVFTDGISSLGSANQLYIGGTPILNTINSIPTASHDFLNYLAMKYSGIYADLTSTTAANAVRALSGKTNRFLGFEGAGVRQVYPIAGTAATKRLFSIAGRADSLPQSIVLKFGPSQGEVTSRVNLRIRERPSKAIDAQKLWAQKAIEGLSYNYDQNKEEIDNLGSRYSIVTRGTSLIVLESIDDYVRFNIVPPADLRPEYDRRKKEQQDQAQQAKQSGASTLNDYWDSLNRWWDNPKGDNFEIPRPSGWTTQMMEQQSVSFATVE
jgi:hypothetical protein